MPWNPEIYNQFKQIRYQPFFDLMNLIADNGLKDCVDIGCGTGEQTNILSAKFESATFLGIDPSPEMLSRSSAFANERVQFKNSTVEEFIAVNQKWDLIFSNAALQWSEHHQQLFPAIISLLNDKGQFAVQMPVQHENILNQLLITLAQEEPFCDFLNGWKRESSLLSIDEYAQLMFDGGLQHIQVIQKVYPIIADDAQQLFDFISGSALIPYLERLHGNEQKLFITEYKKRIEAAFIKFPAIYAFKRLLLYGRKGKW